MKDILWIILFYFIGVMYTAFSLSQIILMLATGIPVTKLLSDNNLLINNYLKKRNIFTIILHVIIGIIILYMIFQYCYSIMIYGFMAGVIFGIFINLKLFRRNIINTRDFIERSKRLIDTSIYDIDTIYTFTYTHLNIYCK
jgi:hypothetical protein